MDIITTMKQFSDQESCLLYIEEQRWHGEVCCPRCGSVNVGRRKNLQVSPPQRAHYFTALKSHFPNGFWLSR